MALIKRDKRTYLMLIALLLVSQIYFGLIRSAAADDAEHTYVIFEDDFEDGEAGDWTINIPDEAPPGSSCAVELDDGNYVLSSRGQTWTGVGDFTWTNYTFEVKFKFITPQGCAMINFRLGGPAHRYFLQFWVEDFFLTKQYLETYSEVKYKRLAINTNTWYTLKIVCVGNNISAYVNDVLKLQYIDTENPFLTGRIGLETCADSYILFDDVKVSTTHRLYVTYLIEKAEDEISLSRTLEGDTGEAEQRLAEAQVAFDDGDLSLAESLAKDTINLAEHAPVGPVSIGDLLKYFAEYDQHTVEISGTVRDIGYEEGVYILAVDDGTGVISATFNGTLGEIKVDDNVKVVGIFDASTTTVMVESLEKVKPPMEGLYTFLIFKDDFEDGNFSDWLTWVSPEVEGSEWKVETEGDNHVLSGFGDCWGEAGDPEWIDYIFEVKIKLIKGDAGIQFRMTPKPEGIERYIIMLYHQGIGGLCKTEIYLKEERWNELKQIDFDLKRDEWYTVRIICLENNIKVYLDDVLKLDYTDEDDPNLSGFIGLGVSWYEDYKPSHILFDDVKVSRIATTGDIGDLITYAQSEIDEAREINADVSAAELKLEQARQALTQEEYKMVQYMVDEAVWMAKRASVGQISIRDLEASSTRISGHTVTITGTVKDLEARYGVGYDFALDDGTGRISVAYQGALDIGDEYEVKVTGAFDAPSGTVTASKIEKISGPSTPSPGGISGPAGITLNNEQIATLISIGGAGAAVVGWMVRTRSASRRRKILFKNLMDEIDDIYSRFKMNARRCEAELYKLRDQVLDEFKEGAIDEDNYKVLDKRLDGYMKEIKEEIAREEK